MMAMTDLSKGLPLPTPEKPSGTSPVVIFADDAASDVSGVGDVEASLRESDERLKTIFNSVRAGILIIDPETHIIVDANPVAVEMVGCARSQIVGAVCHQHVCPAERGRCPITDLGQSVDNSERKLLKAGGSVVPIIKTISSFALKGRQYLLESFIDITEHKGAEEALKASEERYRGLFNGFPVGLYRTSAEGELIDVNPAVVELLGYPDRESLLNINVSEAYVKPEERLTFQETLLKEGLIRNFVYQLRRYDGSLIWVEDNARAVRDTDGHVLYYVGSMVDITQRRRSEQAMVVLQDQLRQSQKMEAVGQLAGGIAHDFNNLLTVIGGYTELSLRHLNTGDALKDIMEGIQKASNRAAELTRQLLAFSRRQLMEMKVLDLNSLLRDLDKMLHRLIGEDIEVVTLLPQDLGCVRADPGQIEQVIMNLAVNARDAMPSGGRLTIETGNVNLDESYALKHAEMPTGRYVMLSVSDTGQGMTAQVRERVFEPFFTTKEKGKGTGLGLSTVYGIVKQSAGYVWVYSEPGIGTSFKIYLPRIDDPAEAIDGSATPLEDMRGDETILLVEDDDGVRELTRTTLIAQGYQVIAVSSGHAAMDIYRNATEPIQLILTDIVMPGMGGRELVDQLRPQLTGTKVIYMSGYTQNGVLGHGILHRGINYIQKPYTMDGLCGTVRRVLDRPDS